MALKLLKKLQPRSLRMIYKNAEDLRTATIILKTIYGLFIAFLAVIGVAFVAQDIPLVIIIFIAGILLLIPIILLFYGRIRISSFILLIIVVTMMTLSAVMGQGIHDVALLAFPVAIFFANLILQRRDFLLLSLFIMAALGFLGIGEQYGWFIPRIYKDSAIIDLIIAMVILIVAIMIADALAENIRKNMQLAQREIALRKKAQEELRHLNIHDKLTGIYNRAFFDEMIMLYEKRRNYPVSVIFADMDNLKEINDEFGHAAGDSLLVSTAKVFSAAFRNSDILARIGGDEFAVIMPQTDAKTVSQILQRLHTSIAEFNENNAQMPIRISLGTSTAVEGDLQNSLIAADRNMYENKEIRKTA